ncbi:polycomb group RING finger protein 3-like [Uloborus diversus]|uniref:polycomb group RING finger protein 3-like n=1 Tax=Uloborus diversus TaxID=327109 RepID=UPI002409ECB4|nr:polycomb group RING finger protein 3-like [Uloborus diversus]
METTSVALHSLNPHISCYICKGYLIDATAITECLHTFCKSCIVKRLEFEDVNTCPKCDCLIHRSNPLLGIKADRTLQDIVYKLVPDLQCREVLREKIFCEMKDIPYPKHHDIVIKNKQLQVVDSAPQRVVDAVTDDRVCIQLETKTSELQQLPRKYICCSSFTTIAHVKKLIAKKLFCDLEKYYTVDILCNDEVLGKDHTLKFIYVTRWRSKEPPLMLYYQPRMNLMSLNVTQQLNTEL